MILLWKDTSATPDPLVKGQRGQWPHHASILRRSCAYYSARTLFTPCCRPGVGNLWLASQMWLFWWRHLARLIFSWHDCYEWNFFCNFPSTRQQSHQQRHAAPEVALTVRSMLLKRKFRHLPLFKTVGFA